MDPVTFVIELLFAAVFIGALASLIRGHDPLAGDVTLVFSAPAVIFALQVAEVLVGELPDVVAGAAVALLLAQPFFTLRLVGRLKELPAWGVPAAGIGFLVTAIPFIVVAVTDPDSPLARPLVVAAVIAFVGTEAGAAAHLALEARRRAGSARVRLAIAAIATISFALALFAAGAGAVAAPAADTPATGQPTAAAVASQITLVLASIGYVIAFLPPAWLRRVWQATAAYDQGQALLSAPPTEEEASLWQRLASAAVDVGGGAAAVVVVGGAEGVGRIAAVAGPRAVDVDTSTSGQIGELADLAVGAPLRRIEPGRSVLLDDLATRTDSRFVTIVELTAATERRGFLLHLSRQASLFGADDASLLAALGGAATIMVERRVVLAGQEQLAERLSATVTALESASQAKSDFLASMSHELRTPLNAVIGFSDLMRGEPRDGANVSVPTEWVEHIHSSGQHLLGLINDVLDLAKVEAGRMDLVLERVGLPVAILESASGLRPLADRKSIVIETDLEPLAVDADRGRFRQIIYNLLSNAIKYTHDGGTIRIEVAARGDEVAITVADTGVGISAADQRVVFEEFRQVGDPAGRQPGTGLGLALTKRLVEAHRGRIELESAPGEGSRFTVVFPGPMPARARPPDPSRDLPLPSWPGDATAGVEVLVIEDDPGAARLLRAYLEGDGYHVRIAADGEQGLFEAKRSRPAAIVLDVILPGLDGWDVLRQLKTDERLREVPVIIVTVVDEREVGLALGAADYLVKPVQRAALLTCLARIADASTGRATPIRVLAVDDDPATLDMIDASLGPNGFEVIRASGGQRGLDLARSSAPDLVICDLLMPDLDGFGVVAELSADPATRHLPILILTAHELSPADKSRLNGKILGVVAKGENGKAGLHDWLARALAPGGPASQAGGP
jgi:signal transduction histidine kinase/CheY-like chemotaxis protein